MVSVRRGRGRGSVPPRGPCPGREVEAWEARRAPVQTAQVRGHRAEVRDSPTHCMPSRVLPAEHRQTKDPGLFLHSAFTHGFDWHSSISAARSKRSGFNDRLHSVTEGVASAIDLSGRGGVMT